MCVCVCVRACIFSVFPFVRLSACMCVNVYLRFCLSVCLSLYVYVVYLSDCLSVCLCDRVYCVCVCVCVLALVCVYIWVCVSCESASGHSLMHVYACLWVCARMCVRARARACVCDQTQSVCLRDTPSSH